MSGAERRYIHLDVINRQSISYEKAAEQVRAMAASGEDNALSSSVEQTLTRIAQGLEECAKAKQFARGAGHDERG